MANQSSTYGDYLTNPSQAVVSPLALPSKNKLKLVDGSTLPPSATDRHGSDDS